MICRTITGRPPSGDQPASFPLRRAYPVPRLLRILCDFRGFLCRAEPGARRAPCLGLMLVSDLAPGSASRSYSRLLPRLCDLPSDRADEGQQTRAMGDPGYSWLWERPHEAPPTAARSQWQGYEPESVNVPAPAAGMNSHE